jgi:flagellar basal-body rod protein FlgG
MLRGMWSAASGMAAQQTTIDVISNNLANVNTTSFKKSRAEFQDLMYQTLNQGGSETPGGDQIPTGIQVGMGTETLGVQKMFMQGDFLQTKNELDIAIQGKGFFRVLSNDQELYTRAGNFKLDSEGNIVTAGGDRLQPEMAVPEGTLSITINKYGQVTAFDAVGSGVVLGEIELYGFANPAGLSSLGHNLYGTTDASGEATFAAPGSEGMGMLLQGFVEKSNVDVVEEMVSMIMAQRAYEINSKSIQTADSMLQAANNLKR